MKISHIRWCSVVVIGKLKGVCRGGKYSWGWGESRGTSRLGKVAAHVPPAEIAAAPRQRIFSKWMLVGWLNLLHWVASYTPISANLELLLIPQKPLKCCACLQSLLIPRFCLFRSQLEGCKVHALSCFQLTAVELNILLGEHFRSWPSIESHTATPA